MKKPALINNRQDGLTLIELMIAIVISSIVMIGVGTVFVSSTRAFKLQEEFARLQENGRFAINYIGRFVRDAGYVGCASGTIGSVTNDLNNAANIEWNFATGLEGYEASGTGPGQAYNIASSNPSPSSTTTHWTAITSTNAPASLVDGSPDAPIPGSDILVSRSADSNGVDIARNNNSGTIFLNITSQETGACADNTNRISGICNEDILMISDCRKSIIFQATNTPITGSPSELNIEHASGGAFIPGNNVSSWGGANPPPERTFKPGAEVFKVSTKVFYIGQGNTGPALFVKIGDAAGQELVEGIESMQILYGEDTSGDGVANRYVTATNVVDFQNIISVKVSLLLRTIKELSHRSDSTTTTTYQLSGFNANTSTTINPVDDKRVRRVMSATIRLRNRAFTL